jgi:hypothetical protein
MSTEIGTPRTLDEAIRNAICTGPLSGVSEQLYHHIKDFLAQRFGVAFIKAGDDNHLVEMLETLYKECMKRRNDASDQSKTS